MKNPDIRIKLSYVNGLRSIVLSELVKNNIEVISESTDAFLVNYSENNLQITKKLRSVARAYLVVQDSNFNPTHISKHKSILGNLVDLVINSDTFKTFKISCAGSDSVEVKNIARYIKNTYKIEEAEGADLKVHIIKLDEVWEVGIQTTPRPLSVRDYRVRNMSGAMDPTVAYAVNSFCNLESANSYLNIFSGSGTLMIEAIISNPNLEKLIGFDNNKKHLSLSIQNIKKAGCINKISVKEADIFDTPNLGKFDVITSDLPFGMVISKDEDLEKLYLTFVEYCESVLNIDGRLSIYTSKYDTLEPILIKSKFKIIESITLKSVTNVNSYLTTKIIVCSFKTN